MNTNEELGRILKKRKEVNCEKGSYLQPKEAEVGDFRYGRFGMGMVLIFLSFFVVSNAPAASLKISMDGQALASIVIPDQPSAAEEFAATELKEHLNKITGGSFQVVRESESDSRREIHVGRTHFGIPFAQGLAPESLSIHYSGPKIALIGGGDAGTLFSVYEFLERRGVHWYVPDVLGTIIPSKPTLYVELVNIVQSPAFELRGLDDGIWGLRNKTNFIAYAALPFPKFSAPEGRRIHTMHSWMPPEVYYTSHPEYYALVDGSRDPFRFTIQTWSMWKEEVGNLQLPGVIAGNIANYYKENPGTEKFLLCPLDGMNWSESEESIALDEPGALKNKWQQRSRRYYVFYNRIAERVKEKAPGIRLIGYAYGRYNYPPLDSSSMAQDNLDLMVAHYDAFDLARPVNDPESSCNAEFVSVLDGWEQLFGKRLYVFEYYVKYNWYGLPWPIAHTIAADMPYFWSRQIKGVLSQSNLSEDAWTNGLNFYLASKLLWDPSLDPEAIKRHWIRGLFAEAAEPMAIYYKVMEESMAKQTCIPGDARQNAIKIFTPQVLARMRANYDKAISLAIDPKVISRLEMVGVSLSYTERVMQVITMAETDPHGAASLLSQFIEEYENQREQYKHVVPDEVFTDTYLRGYLKWLNEK